MKNARWGFFQRSARSTSALRLQVLMLINALAMMVTWLVGRTLERSGMDKQFQANTLRYIKVLSTFYLGLQCLQRKEIMLTMADLWQSMTDLHRAVEQYAYR